LEEVKVEVMGPEPPCARCQSVKKAVYKVAQELAQNGIQVHVERIARKNREVENRDCIRSRIKDV